MNDDKMAKEYNIEGGSVLHLVSATLCFMPTAPCWSRQSMIDSRLRYMLQVLALRGGC